MAFDSWQTVPTLAKAGPNSDPCDRPLNISVHSKKINVWYTNVSLNEKLKWSNFNKFYLLLIKQTYIF